jgi:hypothetical protein
MARDRTRGQGVGRARGDDLRSAHDRTRIAQTAARLIAEHGLRDWSLAKRKAARQLMLPDSAALPSNDEVEAALITHHSLFGGEAHAQALHRQRGEALAWMRRLSAWDPLLVGGVAAGWATAHSDVRIELVADDPKAVEMALAGAGIGYSTAPPGDDASAAGGRAVDLFIATPVAGIRLSILTPQQRRNRPRQDDEPRLRAADVATLLQLD